RATAHKPLLGWGFGDFRDIFAESFTESSLFEGRVHSVGLEVAVGAGWPAAAALLIAWLLLWVHRQRATSAHTRFQLRACAALVAYNGVHLLVCFDQPALGAWVWTLAGFALAAGAASSRVGWGLGRWRWLGAATVVALTLVALSAQLGLRAAAAAEEPEPR